MKKMLSLVCLTVIVTMAFPIFSVSAATNDSSISSPSYDYQAMTKEFTNYIGVNPDHTLTLTVPKEVSIKYASEIVASAETALDATNNSIKEGFSTTTENGTVYFTGDTDACIQGGNVNSYQESWFGWKFQFSHTRAPSAAYQFNRMGFATLMITGGLATVGGICGLISIPSVASIIGIPCAVLMAVLSAICFICAGLVGMLSAWCFSLESSINYNNGRTSRGVVVEVYKAVYVYQCYPQ